jgi:acyl dehydratase
VSRAEEYLADHFPGFPILPGVLMVETMVQAARRLLAGRGGGPMVLGEVSALRFGSMVRPGETLEVEVTVGEPLADGSYPCRASGWVVRVGDGPPAEGDEPVAASGRFMMRPLRMPIRRSSGPA